MASVFSSLSQSSRASLGGSSTASHKIKRGVAQVALDSANLSMGVNLQVQDGDYFDTLQIGTNERKALNEPGTLALLTIHYCQRGLKEIGAHTLSLQTLSEDSGAPNVSQAQADKVKEMRDLINHDYLVLELQRGGSSGEKMYILAHKLGTNNRAATASRGAGIHITSIPLDELPLTLHRGVKVHDIDCGFKKFIPLDTLIGILEKEDPNYNLRNNNCWDYAVATTKWLVMECIRVTESTDRSEKDRLQKEVDQLEANLNRNQMFSTAKILLNKATNMFSSR